MDRVALKRRFGLAVATACGAGYVPGAPGTAGSLLGALAAWGLHWAGGWPALAVAVALLLPISVWAADQAEQHYGQHDSCHIVIDEVVGQMIALLPTPCDPATVLFGFGFFRLFDSLKPFPARWIDRHVGGGRGVVLDDVAAGVQAALVTSLLVYSGLLGKLLAWMHLGFLGR